MRRAVGGPVLLFAWELEEEEAVVLEPMVVVEVAVEVVMGEVVGLIAAQVAEAVEPLDSEVEAAENESEEQETNLPAAEIVA